ncbi:MAG: hypothetical protein DMD97_01375 [Candidatus Rokuibacteriota bacterium]|nr:MAG: hypothetical protein DMD97_01375 [Candidatus Rokubacteria bacterium]
MHARRAATLLLPTALALSRAAAGEFGDPIRGLSPDELQRFGDGRAAFETVEDVADGLDPLVNLGGPLIQTDGIGHQGACTFVGEHVPPQATIVAERRTTPLFGLGLVDAVPDATLVTLAAKQAREQPGTAGRPNMVTDVTTGRVAVGKFGWKSQVPNLLHFSAEAYLNEMGITTPLFPDENCPQGDCALLACDPVPGVDDDLEDVQRFRDFINFLAPPPRLRDPYVGFRALARSFAASPRRWGSYAEYRRLFAQIGCANCHVRSLTTGASPVAALQFQTFQPYSDFLLHDMGSLGDGIEQGQATGGEMRTAPLWGLRLFTAFLHDGRAGTIEEAILAHDGQGRAARDRFAALPAEEKATLVAFLRTL